jgi:hypothetical protein
MRILGALNVMLALAGLGGRPAAAQIVADHQAPPAFEQIPPTALQAASALRVMFRHASVGVTINEGLDCLQGTRDHPDECTLYPDYQYDRRNWSFQPRGNSGWYGKVDDFVAEVEAQLDSFDVFSFKYCYLDGLDGLGEPCGSPASPSKIEQAWTYLREAMEDLAARHPEKIFVWWTIPLTQVGQSCTDALNGRIRSYVFERQQILFDVADIESHDPEGVHQVSGDGWEIALKEYCGEQKPDAQACHPGATGKMLLARGYWWLMARVSGWDGGAGAPSPFVRGNSNADASVDISDAVHLLNFLFQGGAAMSCEKAADANDDGAVDISDAIKILLHLFLDAVPLPAPAGACGEDGSADSLTCGTFAPCT